MRNPMRGGTGFRTASSVVCAAVAAVLLVVGLTTWAYTGPASADTGSASSTTAVTDITGTPLGASTTTSSTAPSVGPRRIIDPTASALYVDNNNCLACHGNAKMASELMNVTRPDGTSIALYVNPKDLENSVHRFNDCTVCHSSEPHDTQSALSKLSQAEKCGTCHQYEYKQYIGSVHGTPQKAGNSDPATCTDCHSTTSSPHNIVRVLDPGASTYPGNIAKTCAKCHDNGKLMGKYGIVEKVYDSYMRSFHGKAISLSGQGAALSQLNTATCTNCHGSHNISAVGNAANSVSGKQNLLKTCQGCHPTAGPEFVAGFPGHRVANSSYLPQVYWGGKLFYYFSRGLLGMGMLLVLSSILMRIGSWTKRKLSRPADKEE